MPGGRPFVLILQKVFWVVAVVQIIFIGALIGAIVQGNKHRHPVLLAFLMTAWLASWVALLPLFGGIWDVAHPVPVTRSNLAAGTNHLKVCQANAILVAYFWMAIPGFAFAFSGEVLRILLGVSHMTTSTRRTSSASTLVEDHRWNNGNSYQRSKKSSKRRSLFARLLIAPDRSIWWQYLLVAIPLVTSLPAPFITARAFSQHDWRAAHADQFTCTALGEDTQTQVSIVMMCHFVPATVVGFAAIVTYLFFRRRTRSIIQSKIHTRLLLRLSALSVLSALGALAYIIVRVGPTGYRTPLSRSLGWVLPIYMITFPLIGATFFVDSDILKIWNGWLNFGGDSSKFNSKGSSPNHLLSISLPFRPCEAFSGRLADHHADLSRWSDQKNPNFRTPSPLPPPRPPPPPPHLRLMDIRRGRVAEAEPQTPPPWDRCNYY